MEEKLTISVPQYQENAPGLIRMISALVFPLSLVMIVLTGTDLCTGSFMVSSIIPSVRDIIINRLVTLVYDPGCGSSENQCVENAHALDRDVLW